MTRFRVSYEIEGTYDPEWAANNKFAGAKSDGMISVAVPMVMGDFTPYRVPAGATVEEVLPPFVDGWYRHTGDGTSYYMTHHETPHSGLPANITAYGVEHTYGKNPKLVYLEVIRRANVEKYYVRLKG